MTLPVWETNQYSGARVTPDQWRQLLQEQLPANKPSWIKEIYVHNTGAPDLNQALRTPDRNKDNDPFDDRMRNTAPGYIAKGWKDAGGIRGPHGFVGPGYIYLGTLLTRRGIHSPGANNKAIAFEMFGNYRIGDDDDDAGVGLQIKDTTCKAIAAVCDFWGMDPDEVIKFHKEDPRTTHDCPGNDIEKPDIIARVKRHMKDLDIGGEHVPVPEETSFVEWDAVVNVVQGDDLNMRTLPSMLGEPKGKLPRGVRVRVIGEAKGTTIVWYRVRSPMGFEGWVSGKFLALPAATPTPAPAEAPPAVVIANGEATSVAPQDMAEPGLAVVQDHNDVAMAFYTGLPFTWRDDHYPANFIRTQLGIEPYAPDQAAGLVGNLMRESYARLETAALGDAKTAYGVGQWRDERQRQLRLWAKKRGRQADDLVTQLMYAALELNSTPAEMGKVLGVSPSYSEKPAGDFLRAAKDVEQATAAGVVFERPAGWIWPKESGKKTSDLAKIVPAARRGDGWSVRLDNAKQMVKEYAIISRLN